MLLQPRLLKRSMDHHPLWKIPVFVKPVFSFEWYNQHCFKLYMDKGALPIHRNRPNMLDFLISIASAGRFKTITVLDLCAELADAYSVVLPLFCYRSIYMNYFLSHMNFENGLYILVQRNIELVTKIWSTQSKKVLKKSNNVTLRQWALWVSLFWVFIISAPSNKKYPLTINTRKHFLSHDRVYLFTPRLTFALLSFPSAVPSSLP